MSYQVSEKLQEAVFQALGHASVCWSDWMAAGVFDAGQAHQIGEELLNQIGQEIDAARGGK